MLCSLYWQVKSNCGYREVTTPTAVIRFEILPNISDIQIMEPKRFSLEVLRVRLIHMGTLNQFSPSGANLSFDSQRRSHSNGDWKKGFAIPLDMKARFVTSDRFHWNLLSLPWF